MSMKLAHDLQCPSKENGEGLEIIDSFLASCARDLDMDVACFGPSDILAALKQKGGRVV